MKNSIFKVLALISVVSLSYAAEAPPQDIGKRLLDTEIQRINKAYEKELASREWMKTSWNKEKRDYYPTAVEDAKKSRDYFIQEAQELYPWYEAGMNAFKSKFPNYEIGGNLNYFMNLNEMTNVIKAKFKEMYYNGQIMTREQFEKQDTSKWYPKGEGLTRIWGAEYLAKKFKENNKQWFKVPRYIIVVDNPNNIQVNLIMTNSCFPIIGQIKNGQIYAEKIEGKEVARKGLNSIGFGYTDYSSPGNIIMDKEGIHYPVDTEYKSFYDGMPEGNLFENFNLSKGDPQSLCGYFQKRFKLLNPGIGSERVIEFSVLD